MKKTNKMAVIGLVALTALCAAGCKGKEASTEPVTEEVTTSAKQEETSSGGESDAKATEEETTEDLSYLSEVDIVDLTSSVRPIMVSVNNITIAQQVQRGLCEAYMIYEIPVEGGITRLLAFYKDPDKAITVGTIRSGRHNMFDIAMESNAIICHYGASTIAKKQEEQGLVEFVNGMLGGGPFRRENPENLPSEHTVYATTSELFAYAWQKGYASEAANAEDTFLLDYDPSDVDLSKADDAVDAKTVTLHYSGAQKTVFKYDEEQGMYFKWNWDTPALDYDTEEQQNCENIIVQYFTYSLINNKLLDFDNVGTGTGYYITNGHAVPINWSKASREAKTIFTYASTGEEITVSDGRTYIEMFPATASLTLE